MKNDGFALPVQVSQHLPPHWHQPSVVSELWPGSREEATNNGSENGHLTRGCVSNNDGNKSKQNGDMME